MTEKKVTTAVSRRKFIKNTAIGAGIVATMGLSVKPATAQKTPEKWDKEFDIIVVGSGAAGHAAAIEAADQKASVVILEKMPVFGGNSMLAGGNYGSYGTDLQKKFGVDDPRFSDDSADLYYKEKRALGGYRSNPILTRAFADHCLEDYKWLTSFGLKFDLVGFYEHTILQPEDAKGLYLGNTYNASYVDGKWTGVLTKGRHHRGGVYKTYKGGTALMNCMRDAAQSRGVDVLTRMEATEIIRQDGLSGDVLGLRVKNLSSGQTIAIRAKKAVILAAGGFSANLNMCIKYDQRLSPKIKNTGVNGVTGEILVAAQDIGAETVNMDFVQIRMDRSAVAYRFSVMVEEEGTYIDVDENGKRFWKEMPDVVAFRSARLSVAHVKNMHLWHAIADSEGIKANKNDEKSIERHLKQKTAYVAQSLGELAKTTGLPEKNLIETVERYNGFVERVKDEDFGQNKAYLKHKIATPPFYAMPKSYYVQHTLGGVSLNEKAQVIDRHDKVIPRLYAAGEISGGVHGLERNGGCGITECVVFGRIAAQHAVKEKPAA